MNIRWNMGKTNYKKQVFYHENSQTLQVALKGCGVSTLRHMQNLTGNDSEQSYLFGAVGWIR